MSTAVVWLKRYAWAIARVAGVLLVILAWRYHSVVVPRLDDHRLNWKLFTMGANASWFNGQPDAYTELSIVTAMATPPGHSIDDGSTTPYADVWHDVRVQRSWMRFILQQQQWAKEQHTFIVAHSAGRAEYATYSARATEAMDSYSRFQELEFRKVGVPPSGLSGNTARRLSDRVWALRTELVSISNEWGNALRLEREQAIEREFFAGALGGSLLLASFRRTAKSRTHAAPAA